MKTSHYFLLSLLNLLVMTSCDAQEHDSKDTEPTRQPTPSTSTTETAPMVTSLAGVLAGITEFEFAGVGFDKLNDVPFEEAFIEETFIEAASKRGIPIKKLSGEITGKPVLMIRCNTSAVPGSNALFFVVDLKLQEVAEITRNGKAYKALTSTWSIRVTGSSARGALSDPIAGALNELADGFKASLSAAKLPGE